MSAFLSPSLGIRPVNWLNGRQVYETTEPMRYRSERLQATVVIPAEFIFDAASVPRLPLTWYIAGGRALRSAAIHDFCYQRGYLVTDDGRKIPVTRREADAIFWESMAVDPLSGTNVAHRFVMWLAVRVGGRWAWKAQEPRAKTLNPIWSREGWPDRGEDAQAGG